MDESLDFMHCCITCLKAAILGRHLQRYRTNHSCLSTDFNVVQDAETQQLNWNYGIDWAEPLNFGVADEDFAFHEAFDDAISLLIAEEPTLKPSLRNYAPGHEKFFDLPALIYVR